MEAPSPRTRPTRSASGPAALGTGLAVMGHLVGLARQWAGGPSSSGSEPCAAAITYVSTRSGRTVAGD
jgi:hypothetical protein